MTDSSEIGYHHVSRFSLIFTITRPPHSVADKIRKVAIEIEPQIESILNLGCVFFFMIKIEVKFCTSNCIALFI